MSKNINILLPSLLKRYAFHPRLIVQQFKEKEKIEKLEDHLSNTGYRP